MNVRLVIIFCIVLSTAIGKLQAQQSTQYWVFYTHNQKINRDFKVLFDAQSRSSSQISSLTTLLLRVGLAYDLSNSQNLALGYVFKRDLPQQEPGGFEHRIYQQYQREFKFGKTELELRGRLEQRFLNDSLSRLAMRARIFFAFKYPIIANADFSRGLYAGFQNELFLNVLNKINVNNHFFDQNRPYLSLGYRINSHIDSAVDFGLMSDRQTVQSDTVPVFRLSFSTDF